MVETPGRVDNDDIVIMPARPVDGGRGDFQRLLPDRRRKKIDADLSGERSQLLDRGRAVHIATHQQHFLAHIRAQQPRELSGRGCLSRTLQSREKNDRGRRGRQIDGRGFASHQPRELALHDPDQRLTGRQRSRDVLSQRFFTDGGNEILDDRQRDVGLEQHHAYFAQGFLDIGVGQSGFAAKTLDDAAKPLGEIVEHEFRDSGAAKDAASVV